MCCISTSDSDAGSWSDPDEEVDPECQLAELSVPWEDSLQCSSVDPDESEESEESKESESRSR
jgi:hypothetical protein